MTFILFASGYAQSNENVFGSTYKLVKGYSKVPSDGIYLIAGYFSEKNGGGSLYLMSSDSLNNGEIKCKLYINSICLSIVAICGSISSPL